jgi:hypothetical protein
MSASHFGSGFWPDDYFGLYFQPEAGGVIIGTLSGSFAGAASFAGTLEQPAAQEFEGHGARYWRTVRKNRENRLRELYEEVRSEDVSPVLEERIEAILEPFRPALQRPTPEPQPEPLPPPIQIDWAAIYAQAEAAERLLAALEEAKREIEDEEDIFLLLAA